MQTKQNPHPCHFNGAVVCVDQIYCDRCGWNPIVAEERLRRIQEGKNKRRGNGEQEKKKIKKP